MESSKESFMEILKDSFMEILYGIIYGNPLWASSVEISKDILQGILDGTHRGFLKEILYGLLY